MPAHRRPPNPRNWIYTSLAVSLAVFLTIVGFGGSSKAASQPVASRSVTASRRPAAPEPSPSAVTSGPGTSSATLNSLAQRVLSQPVRIQIPALGVNAPVIAANVDSQGALEVPDNVTQAVWYQAGSAPGQPGTAIIAAHVDYAGAPGLFNQLHNLAVGSLIVVTDAEGGVHQFRATSGGLAPKSDPSTVESLAAAAGGTGQPQLALITCGGDLDSAAHTYYDNYVLLADA